MTDLPRSLDTPRARARLACLDPDYAARLVAVRRKMEELSLRPADVSDRLGRTTEAERVYVRTLLSGGGVSNPLLTEVEEAVAAGPPVAV